MYRAARRLDVGAVITEIARSEIAYTGQRPAEYVIVMIAAALREGYVGPLFIQIRTGVLAMRRDDGSALPVLVATASLFAGATAAFALVLVPADLLGEWRLLDSEPLAPLEATITPGVLRAYRRLLEAFRREAADFCRRRGLTYIQMRSDVNLQDLLLRTFRSAGILV